MTTPSMMTSSIRCTNHVETTTTTNKHDNHSHQRRTVPVRIKPTKTQETTTAAKQYPLLRKPRSSISSTGSRARGQQQQQQNSTKTDPARVNQKGNDNVVVAKSDQELLSFFSLPQQQQQGNNDTVLCDNVDAVSRNVVVVTTMESSFLPISTTTQTTNTQNGSWGFIQRRQQQDDDMECCSSQDDDEEEVEDDDEDSHLVSVFAYQRLDSMDNGDCGVVGVVVVNDDDDDDKWQCRKPLLLQREDLQQSSSWADPQPPPPQQQQLDNMIQSQSCNDDDHDEPTNPEQNSIPDLFTRKSWKATFILDDVGEEKEEDEDGAQQQQNDNIIQNQSQSCDDDHFDEEEEKTKTNPEQKLSCPRTGDLTMRRSFHQQQQQQDDDHSKMSPSHDDSYRPNNNSNNKVDLVQDLKSHPSIAPSFSSWEEEEDQLGHDDDDVEDGVSLDSSQGTFLITDQGDQIICGSLDWASETSPRKQQQHLHSRTLVGECGTEPTISATSFFQDQARSSCSRPEVLLDDMVRQPWNGMDVAEQRGKPATTAPADAMKNSSGVSETCRCQGLSTASSRAVRPSALVHDDEDSGLLQPGLQESQSWESQALIKDESELELLDQSITAVCQGYSAFVNDIASSPAAAAFFLSEDFGSDFLTNLFEYCHHEDSNLASPKEIIDDLTEILEYFVDDDLIRDLTLSPNPKSLPRSKLTRISKARLRFKRIMDRWLRKKTTTKNEKNVKKEVSGLRKVCNRLRRVSFGLPRIRKPATTTATPKSNTTQSARQQTPQIQDLNRTRSWDSRESDWIPDDQTNDGNNSERTRTSISVATLPQGNKVNNSFNVPPLSHAANSVRSKTMKPVATTTTKSITTHSTCEQFQLPDRNYTRSWDSRESDRIPDDQTNDGNYSEKASTLISVATVPQGNKVMSSVHVPPLSQASGVPSKTMKLTTTTTKSNTMQSTCEQIPQIPDRNNTKSWDCESHRIIPDDQTNDGNNSEKTRTSISVETIPHDNKVKNSVHVPSHAASVTPSKTTNSTNTAKLAPSIRDVRVREALAKQCAVSTDCSKKFQPIDAFDKANPKEKFETRSPTSTSEAEDTAESNHRDGNIELSFSLTSEEHEELARGTASVGDLVPTHNVIDAFGFPAMTRYDNNNVLPPSHFNLAPKSEIVEASSVPTHNVIDTLGFPSKTSNDSTNVLPSFQLNLSPKTEMVEASSVQTLEIIDEFGFPSAAGDGSNNMLLPPSSHLATRNETVNDSIAGNDWTQSCNPNIRTPQPRARATDDASAESQSEHEAAPLVSLDSPCSFAMEHVTDPKSDDPTTDSSPCAAEPNTIDFGYVSPTSVVAIDGDQAMLSPLSTTSSLLSPLSAMMNVTDGLSQIALTTTKANHVLESIFGQPTQFVTDLFGSFNGPCQPTTNYNNHPLESTSPRGETTSPTPLIQSLYSDPLPTCDFESNAESATAECTNVPVNKSSSLFPKPTNQIVMPLQSSATANHKFDTTTTKSSTGRARVDSDMNSVNATAGPMQIPLSASVENDSDPLEERDDSTAAATTGFSVASTPGSASSRRARYNEYCNAARKHRMDGALFEEPQLTTLSRKDLNHLFMKRMDAVC